MKLYAILTSERAQKGVSLGGQKEINIELCGKEGAVLVSIDVTPAENGGIRAKMHVMGDSTTAKTLEAYLEGDDIEGQWIEETNIGKKQTGEKYTTIQCQYGGKCIQ